MKERRIIVGITGATGVVYGIRMLEQLRASRRVETHLVVSRSGHLTRAYETDMSANELIALADHHHNFNDLAAPIASGSFICDGMVVAPCSVKTLAEIAYCNSSSLLTRAADVMLKERKPLVFDGARDASACQPFGMHDSSDSKRCHHRTPGDVLLHQAAEY